MTLQLGWGLDPYGTGGFGSAPSVVGVSFVSAVALSTNEVRVTLSAEPLHTVSVGEGDAFNPNTWTVQRLDTLEFFNVVRVDEISPTVYKLTVLQPFGSALVAHQVSSATLRDAGGGILLPPRKANFAGALAEETATPDAKLASQNAQVRDVANPPLPVSAPDLIGGTLVVGASGDYENVSGSDLLRKLIIRRLITMPGDFFHLPDYGIGLRVKEPIPSGDLVKLKADIDQQVLAEPEVNNVNTFLSLTTDNVLYVQVRAQLKNTGQQIEIGVPIPTSGVVL
jgi:hypothetical protein